MFFIDIVFVALTCACMCGKERVLAVCFTIRESLSVHVVSLCVCVCSNLFFFFTGFILHLERDDESQTSILDPRFKSHFPMLQACV